MAKIITKRRLNPTVTLMEVSAPLIAKKALPGQFIILRVDEKGERIPLTIADYDREKGTITIKRQLRREQKKGGAYYITTPKNGKPRTITPAPWVMKLLRSQKARQAE